MSNIPGAPKFLTAGTDLASARAGTSALGSDTTRAFAATAATTIPQQSTDAPGRVQTRPSRRAARAIVVEPATVGPPTDRLDRDLDVAARLTLPLTAARLTAVLDKYRPALMLCKHSLDSIDESVMAACRAHDLEIYVLAHPVYGAFRPVRLRRFGGLPWLRLRRRAGRSVDEMVKRCVDLTLALLSAPVLVPVMLLILLAVWCGGPPLYFQDRVGAGGRPFRMVKFRTMWVDAERDSGPALASPDDHRVTGLGRVLRRFRLDELPQLWNVLCGHMSMVGPRPERPEFVAELRRLPNYDLRHLIRPGMTGIAQLTGGYAATAEEKLRCDLLYLHYRSLRSDLTLLVLTVLDLFRGFPRG